MLNNFKILNKISEEKIRQQVAKIADSINNEYKGKELVLVGVLNGAFIFLADLVRQITIPLKVDFVRVASYGSKSVSNGEIKFTKDIEMSVKGKSVILVEDIVDTGITLSYLVRQIEKKDPESVKICALINKLERREKAVEVSYSGFEINKGFVVGYGLDYNEDYRYLPYILSFEIVD